MVGGVQGGVSDVTLGKSDEVVKFGFKTILRSMNLKASDVGFWTLDHATEQVVQGMLYNLTIRLRTSQEMHRCKVSVWDRVREDGSNVLMSHHISCTKTAIPVPSYRSNIKSRPGSPSIVDLERNDTKVQFGLRTILAKEKLSKQDLIAWKLENATKQVVEGLLYKLYFNLNTHQEDLACQVTVLLRLWLEADSMEASGASCTILDTGTPMKPLQYRPVTQTIPKQDFPMPVTSLKKDKSTAGKPAPPPNDMSSSMTYTYNKVGGSGVQGGVQEVNFNYRGSAGGATGGIQGEHRV